MFSGIHTADMDTLTYEAAWIFDMDDSRDSISEFSEHYHSLRDAVQIIEDTTEDETEEIEEDATE